MSTSTIAVLISTGMRDRERRYTNNQVMSPNEHLSSYSSPIFSAECFSLSPSLFMSKGTSPKYLWLLFASGVSRMDAENVIFIIPLIHVLVKYALCRVPYNALFITLNDWIYEDIIIKYRNQSNKNYLHCLLFLFVNWPKVWLAQKYF